MTDKDRVGDSPVSTAYSPDNGTVIIAGNTDKSLIDLDESYQTIVKENVGKLIEGAERLITDRVLERSHMKMAGIKGTEHFDPMPSRRNAILGGETFIVTLRDKFVAFIKLIIKFITDALRWVGDRVKNFFGWGKTQERIKELDGKAQALQDDLVGLLRKLNLGGPELFDVERLFDEKPSGLTRLETIKFIQGKFSKVEDNIDGLTQAIDFSQRIQGELISISREVGRDKAELSKHIKSMKASLGKGEVRLVDAERMVVICNQISLKTLQNNRVYKYLAELAEAMYAIKLPENLNTGVAQARAMIDQARKTANARLNPSEASNLSKKVTLLTAKIIDRPMDMQKISDLLIPDDVVSLNEAEVIEAYLKALDLPPAAAQGISSAYLKMSDNVKEYVMLISLFSNQFNDLTLQLTSFIQWNQRVNALLNAYIYKDIDEVTKVYTQLGEEGIDLSDYKPVMTPRNGTYNGLQVLGMTGVELVRYNMGGTRTALSKFMLQLGMNPGVIFNG